MKGLLYMAASAIGFGAVVLVQKLIGKKKDTEQQHTGKNIGRSNEPQRSAGSRSGLSQMSVKGDGSLDMRYKENKEAARDGDAAHSAVHLKKNGEPDRRYKENRDL